MNNANSLLFLISLLFVFSYCWAQTDENETCRRRGYSNYVCKIWDKCSAGTEIIKSGLWVSCGSPVNNKPKLCCPPETSVVIMASKPKGPKANSTTGSQITRLNTSKPKNATEIAEKMCKEYKKYRYEYHTIPSPILGNPPVEWNETNCVNIQKLIVGGTLAEPKEYPHMALIGYGDLYSSVSWLCGGSLISDKFVLSAAHCGKAGALGNAKWVRLGDLNLTSENDDARPVVFRIEEIFIHPRYKAPQQYNDIALFRLNDSVKFNAYTRPTCLATSILNPPVGTRLSISGWGRTETSSSPSEYLLKAVIFLNSSRACNVAYTGDTGRFRNGFDDASMLCAGDSVAGKDTCSGDSGGPLQILEENDFCTWRQLGITSVGAGLCGDPDIPAIYTKVSNYIEWIQNIVWPES